MEYDNDRQVKHPYKMEIFYWVLIGIIYPFINGVGIFMGQPKIWSALFLVSLFLLPAYLLFSMVVAPRLFIQKHYAVSVLLSILFLSVIQVLQFILFTIILKSIYRLMSNRILRIILV